MDGGKFQPGTYGPSVQDGIYLMLPPLPAGLHEIQFSAAGLHGWGLDVTYHLTVRESGRQITQRVMPASNPTKKKGRNK